MGTGKHLRSYEVILVPTTQSSGPRPAPVFFSLVLHFILLSWVAFGPRVSSDAKPKSLYMQVIAPHEKKLVWYRLSSKLPDVSPPEPDTGAKQLRAEVRN